MEFLGLNVGWNEIGFRRESVLLTRVYIRVKRQFGGRDIINFKYSVHFMHIRDRFTTNEVNSNIEDLRNIFFFFLRQDKEEIVTC